MCTAAQVDRDMQRVESSIWPTGLLVNLPEGGQRSRMHPPQTGLSSPISALHVSDPSLSHVKHPHEKWQKEMTNIRLVTLSHILHEFQTNGGFSLSLLSPSRGLSHRIWIYSTAAAPCRVTASQCEHCVWAAHVKQSLALTEFSVI